MICISYHKICLFTIDVKQVEWACPIALNLCSIWEIPSMQYVIRVRATPDQLPVTLSQGSLSHRARVISDDIVDDISTFNK